MTRPSRRRSLPSCVLVKSAVLFFIIVFAGTGKVYSSSSTDEYDRLHIEVTRITCGNGFVHNSGSSGTPWECKPYSCGSAHWLPCPANNWPLIYGTAPIQTCPEGKLAVASHSKRECLCMDKSTVYENGNRSLGSDKYGEATDMVCQKGFECDNADTHSCYPTECPRGYMRSDPNGACSPAVCPKGYTYNDEQKKCYREDTGSGSAQPIQPPQGTQKAGAKKGTVLLMREESDKSVSYYHGFRAFPEAATAPPRTFRSAQTPTGKPVILRSERFINGIAGRIVGSGALDKARREAEQIMREILKNIPASTLEMIYRQGYTVYIIPSGQLPNQLPQFSRIEHAGIGAIDPDNKVIGICEDDLLGKVKGFPPGRFFTHEVAKAIAFSTQGTLPFSGVERNFAEVKRSGRLPADYMASNEYDYFANSTEAWFGVHSQKKSFTLSKIGIKTQPAYDRRWIKDNDPVMYKLLDQLYEDGKADQTKPRQITPNAAAMPHKTSWISLPLLTLLLAAAGALLALGLFKFTGDESKRPPKDR